MLSETVFRLAKKEKSPVFGGIWRPMTMNDRRLARAPGNPMRKYPFYKGHRWDASKKYMCTDFRHPDPASSLAQFALRYQPSADTSAAADLVERTLRALLPGCRVAREPTAERTSFRLTRLNDARLIAEVAPASRALFVLPEIGNLRDKATLAGLVSAARFW
jgi:hypothetical protein